MVVRGALEPSTGTIRRAADQAFEPSAQGVHGGIVIADNLTMADQQALQPGTLYLVGTPIGNRGDWSARARSVLQSVDLVLAEDTRVTGLLCHTTGISVRLESFHAHNTARRIPEVILRLQQGQTMALVSDRGMPTISDPGQELVDALWLQGLRVSVVPGPSAGVAAFSVSGFPAPYAFWGFLPRSGEERRAALEALAQWPHAAVVYESPHHIKRTLMDLMEEVGERDVLLAREITKLHEEFWRGPLSQLAGDVREWRGECVLVLGPRKKNPGSGKVDWNQLVSRVNSMVSQGLHLSEAIRQVAQENRVSRRDLYQRVHRD